MSGRDNRNDTTQAPTEPMLELRLLGPMRVGDVDGGTALPRSRKTRALLGFLALQAQPVRREQLCEIFWDLPDDPRAALRWSLSKLRPVLDTPDRKRLIADRNTVALERQSIDIDAVRLMEASRNPQDWPTQALLPLVAAGELLEGLDLAGAILFESWLAAERATLQVARQALLRHLIARHANEPETALQFARALIDINALDTEAWISLVGVLAACGRHDEAEQQRALGLRTLDEVGLPNAGLRLDHTATQTIAQPAVKQISEQQTAAPRDYPSVAVLPFAEFGATMSRSGVSDALARDVIVELSRRRWLTVIAWASTFQFQSSPADLADVGRVLNVRYALTGSCHIHGDKLRITIELAECDTGRILWADGLERPFADIFALRRTISEQIAASVSQEIEQSEIIRARDLEPADLGAWARYHRGLGYAFRFNGKDNETARDLFTEAVEDDPTFSSAFAALSFTHFQRAFVAYSENTQDEIQTALHFAERSLDLDPRNPRAHYAYGRACLIDKNFAAATEALEMSVQLEQSFAHGHYSLAMALCQAGDPLEALRNVKHAEMLSPIDPLQFAMLSVKAFSEIRLGHFQEAATYAVSAATKPNSHVQAAAIAAMACMLAGREDEARIYAGKTRKRKPDYALESFLAAFPNFNAADRETMLAPLRDLGFS